MTTTWRAAEKAAVKVPLRICRKPLVKDCSSDKVRHQTFLATKVAHQTFLVTKVVNQTVLVTKVAHQTSKLRMKHYCKKDVSQNIPFHRMFWDTILVADVLHQTFPVIHFLFRETFFVTDISRNNHDHGCFASNVHCHRCFAPISPAGRNVNPRTINIKNSTNHFKVFKAESNVTRFSCLNIFG